MGGKFWWIVLLVVSFPEIAKPASSYSYEQVAGGKWWEADGGEKEMPAGLIPGDYGWDPLGLSRRTRRIGQKSRTRSSTMGVSPCSPPLASLPRNGWTAKRSSRRNSGGVMWATLCQPLILRLAGVRRFIFKMGDGVHVAQPLVPG